MHKKRKTLLILLVVVIGLCCLVFAGEDMPSAMQPPADTADATGRPNTDDAGTNSEETQESAVVRMLHSLGFTSVDETILETHIPDYADTVNVEKNGTQAFKLTTLNSAYFVTVDNTGKIVKITSTEAEYKLRTVYYPEMPITYDVVDLVELEDAWFYNLADSYSENFGRRIQCEFKVYQFSSISTFRLNDTALVSGMTILYFPDGAVYDTAKLVQVGATIEIRGQIIEYNNDGIFIKVENIVIK